MPYSVTVVPGSTKDYGDDTWLTVSGFLANEGGGFVFEAERITETREPKNPYLCDGWRSLLHADNTG